MDGVLRGGLGVESRGEGSVCGGGVCVHKRTLIGLRSSRADKVIIKVAYFLAALCCFAAMSAADVTLERG